MQCSFSKYFKWCKELPAGYEDDMGNPFCIFHAPVKNKGSLHADEFNELVFERIREAERAGKPCNLSGTVFEWDISFRTFDSDHPLHEISFLKAKFCAASDFKGVTFNESVNFSGATFTKMANFEHSQFKGETLFLEAIFHDKAYFFDATFFGKVNFLNVSFEKQAYFSWGAFKGGGNFENVTYNDKTIFKRPAYD